MLRGNLRLTSIPSRRSTNTPSRFILQKPELSGGTDESSWLAQLRLGQTLPYLTLSKAGAAIMNTISSLKALKSTKNPPPIDELTELNTTCLRLQSTFRETIFFKMYFLGQNEVLRIIFHLKKNYLKGVNIDGEMKK